ncbi:MAG: YDG domain-containing protein, partial [Chlorobiaceae bacterium]
NVSGLTLKDVSGSNMTGNYNITYTSSITGSITQASLIVTTPDNVTKTYNGLFDVPVAYSATVGNLVAGDLVNTAATLLYVDKNVGANKTINVSGLTLKDVSGSNMTGNYSITYTPSITGSITQASLTVMAPNSVTKIYNGLFDVPVAYSATLGLLATGDSVNSAATLLYADKNVGTNKTINVSGLTLKDVSGSNMTGNYSITYTPSITGSITPAPLTVTARNQTKLYDGSSYSGGNGVVFEPVPSSSDYDGTLVYTGTSQGAIQRGTYVITPGGYTSSNYNITFADGQLTILSSVPTPQEWFVSNIPSSPPATLVQVNVGDKTQGNESGVPGLKSMDAVSGNEQPVTRVFMPEEFVRSSSSFIFPLPENVQSQLSGSIGPENVFLQDGSPLPSWLQYDAQNKVFRANHAPEGAIPVTVIVKQGDLSWSVVILQ